MVVIAAPISTTNMTGFLATARGSNLRNDSPTAARTSGPWNRLPAPDLRVAVSSLPSSVSGVRVEGGRSPRVGSASRSGTERGARLDVVTTVRGGVWGLSDMCMKNVLESAARADEKLFDD